MERDGKDQSDRLSEVNSWKNHRINS